MRLSRVTLLANHTPDAISLRLSSGPRASYLKDMIYGAIDGAVTTFAVVSGVAGAGLPSGVLIVLGLANLMADGFSMAASNYLGTRAENQQLEQLRATELHEIIECPEGEREEIRQIYQAKGFSGELLEEIVEVITSKQQLWVDTMLTEEHGVALKPQKALLSGLMTFVAFFVAGGLPLVPFLLNWFLPELITKPFIVSALLTLFVFLFVGVLKGRRVGVSGVFSALETFMVGGAAAVLAYVVGLVLKPFL